MKLLIDIDKNLYKVVQNEVKGKVCVSALWKSIANGIPYEERPQGEWIPVSERLPEEGQDVLVCLTYKDTTHFAVTRLMDNKRWLLFSETEVIAWKPLPEPYKKGDTE